jgi:hypothetical protein
LRPLFAAWEQEFGKSTVTVDASLPEPPPSADPMVVVKEAEVPTIGPESGVAELPRIDEAGSRTATVSTELGASPTEPSPTLYVRRANKSYRPARPTDTPGQRWRRELKSGRAKYTPVGGQER